MDLKKALKTINNISIDLLTPEKKQLVNDILTLTLKDNGDVDEKIFRLILPIVKIGFIFDKAPEVDQDNIAVIQESKNYPKIGTNGPCHSLIIGENYEALKNLKLIFSNSENDNKSGLIDFIYIDPPYNTQKTKEDGNDYKEDQETYSEDFLKLNNKKTSKKPSFGNFIYRDKYKRTGWLNMMDERLRLAKSLLKKDGLIFISIDDSEFCYLKIICDDIFGADNFISSLVWHARRGGGNDVKLVAVDHEYIICYSNCQETSSLQQKRNNLDFIKKCQNLLRSKNLLKTLATVTTSTGNKNLKDLGINLFPYPKPVNLIKELISVFSKKDSIILDFFAGSGTTGQAVMELNEEDGGNRKFILVTNNENNIAKDITYERLYRVINGKGTKNQKIKWKYTSSKQSLTNNTVNIFEINHIDQNTIDKDRDKILEEVKEQLRKLNPNPKFKDIDLTSDLSSLYPYHKYLNKNQ
ncbi:site-specific DNA-methyltransferase [Mycoplasma sp. SG1]|uniref:site-specific DNA-methyltransferase n=1 Tax=Mycoplasma sp. SG1 TaxID=2810348 RepID=UPI002024CFF9|nr:site-specific DNA-methyltransferase [Mycoplasma sp. SG1]URM52988.1 site-specific DNA-methyltransferase [Mycoplasma sp. SG1]